MKKYSMQKYHSYAPALLICTILSCSVLAQTKKEPWQLAEETEVWIPIPTTVNTSLNSPPSDAIVLFDGDNLNAWHSAEGGDANWRVKNGVLRVKPKTGDIKTKESFCDVQLHFEWQTPTKITGNDRKLLEGQARHNSGVFLQERYEIQILDSYNNKTYSNGQAGAVYKQSIPLVNASKAPGEWQSYDIIFISPKFNPDKKLATPGYITLLHNGVLVQNHFEIQGKTEWIGKPKYDAHNCAPLRLQDHGNPVSFRNIWIRRI